MKLKSCLSTYDIKKYISPEFKCKRHQRDSKFYQPLQGLCVTYTFHPPGISSPIFPLRLFPHWSFPTRFFLPCTFPTISFLSPSISGRSFSPLVFSPPDVLHAGLHHQRSFPLLGLFPTWSFPYQSLFTKSLLPSVISIQPGFSKPEAGSVRGYIY